MFAHANDALGADVDPSDKIEKIREIIAQGEKVGHCIVRHNIKDEDTAHLVCARRYILCLDMTDTSATSDASAQACTTLLAESELEVEKLIDAAAAVGTKADFADIYLEHSQSESWALDEGRIDTGTYAMANGMSLRAACGETCAFASADLISAESLKRIQDAVIPAVGCMAQQQAKVHLPTANGGHAEPRYDPDSPLGLDDAAKISLLRAIDEYARSADERIHNVIARISLAHKNMLVVRSDGNWHADMRPMYNLHVTVILMDGAKVETGAYAIGGRKTATHLNADIAHGLVDEAIRKASSKLGAANAPGGVMPVVLGNGWSGILLHEAIGHGLEGDFNRKGQSAFSGRIGERIAPPGVTVVDDGTLFGRRGSLSCDDEGSTTACNTLIEDGILRNYMQDLVNASLMGVTPTGNGRRESYRHEPMPRMTNTYMLNGTHTPEEVIASVDKGLYCKSFGGGSVDITNGNFNFYVEEAYLIEKGKLGACVKGATIIGNGPDSMTKMSMVANDMDLDPGVGTCGKNGQWVPVGVGQPHCKVDEMLVGGTEI